VSVLQRLASSSTGIVRQAAWRKGQLLAVVLHCSVLLTLQLSH
jgi:hypothetical protein